MKILLQLLGFLFVFTLSAQARIGETLEECQKRYENKDFKMSAKPWIYSCKPVKGITLILVFNDKGCEKVLYAKDDKTSFTVQELEQLLEANTGIKLDKWQTVDKIKNGMTITAGGYEGYISFKDDANAPLTISITTKEASEKERVREQRKAANDLDGI